MQNTLSTSTTSSPPTLSTLKADKTQLREAATLIERQRRIRKTSIIIPGVLGAVTALSVNSIDQSEIPLNLPKEAILILALSFFAMSGLSAILAYLRTGFNKSFEEELEDFLLDQNGRRERERLEASDKEIAKLRSELKSLKAELSQHSNVKQEEPSLDAIAEARKRILSEASESILSELKATAEDSAKKSLATEMIYIEFGEISLRIKAELESLKRRADINLGAGGITAVLGLAIFIVLINSTPSATDFWSFASSFGPKITLVILIQAFSYFFLKMYKANLLEIKYFQNELTTIQSKLISLISVIDLGDRESQADIIKTLALTERNHILQKDQTTIEIEKSKIEKESSDSLIRSMVEIFKSAK